MLMKSSEEGSKKLFSLIEVTRKRKSLSRRDVAKAIGVDEKTLRRMGLGPWAFD